MSYYQIIYNRLRQNGLTEAGAIGMLGNWQAESNCEPSRVQGDFSPYRTSSKQYVADVTTGRITRDQFGHDGKGFGLYQLTYFSRKLGYYDFWKQSGKALDDATLQTDYAIIELKRYYPNLYKFLCTTNDIYSATDRICREFERPYHNNVDARYQSALQIKNQIDLSGSNTSQPEESSSSGASGADPGPEPEPSQPKIETWPPRVVDLHCSGWPEVWLLQALLKCHGLNVLVDGIFGDALSSKVKQWQRDNGLTPDGAVGPMSWTSLGISPEAFKK